MTRPVPQAKVVKSRKGWGIRVKWPRRGPWYRTMILPRWSWHGPYGLSEVRWPEREGAESFLRSFERSLMNTLQSH